MAEATQQTTSDSVYRPLSALAVAGFVVSCLFGVIVVVSAAIGLFQGTPFFFPPLPVLVVAVAGFLLSYSGSSDIRNAEGTKAGGKLASWGMGLSLVCGLSYFAYYHFTGLALTQQAHAFLTVLDDNSGFFPRLKKAGSDKTELHRAFLLTLPAFDRGGAAEDEAGMVHLYDQPAPDGSAGKLTRFSQDNLVRVLMLGGDQVQIEPLGVQGWKYENRSYQVTRHYKVTSPEIIMDLVVTVKSSEAESEGQGRTWFFDLRETQRGDYQMTPEGEALRRLRLHANQLITKLHQDLQRGGNLADIAGLDKTDWSKVNADPPLQAQAKAILEAVFAGKAPGPGWQLRPELEATLWPWRRDEEGRVIFDAPAAVTVSLTPSMQRTVDIIFEMRSKKPVDFANVAAAENADDMPGWDILSFRVKRVGVMKRL